MLRRAIIALWLMTLTAACALDGTLARVPQGLAPATTQDIYFATSRNLDQKPFGIQRSRNLFYGEAQISIPPIHQPGQIEWPKGTPDPQKHFLLAGTAAYPDAASFRRRINAALAQQPPGSRDVAIYVHGFNNNFGEGLYRMAQMVHDIKVPGVALHYSWPSADQPLNYTYDRDSALFARRGLKELITQLSRTNANRIVIAAHSLGSLVTMETLVQLSKEPGQRAYSRIGGVLLMSPDLDVDVFRAQADDIGSLPQPFIVFSSKEDRALRLIERLNGHSSQRLGRLTDLSPIEDLSVTYIDTTAVSEGGVSHFTVAKSPAMIQLLKNLTTFDAALSAGGSGRTGLLPGAVLTVQNSTRLVLGTTR